MDFGERTKPDMFLIQLESEFGVRQASPWELFICISFEFGEDCSFLPEKGAGSSSHFWSCGSVRIWVFFYVVINFSPPDICTKTFSFVFQLFLGQPVAAEIVKLNFDIWEKISQTSLCTSILLAEIFLWFLKAYWTVLPHQIFKHSYFWWLKLLTNTKAFICRKLFSSLW